MGAGGRRWAHHGQGHAAGVAHAHRGVAPGHDDDGSRADREGGDRDRGGGGFRRSDHAPRSGCASAGAEDRPVAAREPRAEGRRKRARRRRQPGARGDPRECDPACADAQGGRGLLSSVPRARRAAPRAKGDTRAAKFAQEIVAQLDRADASSGDEAPLESLPAVLANPPWRAKRRPTRKRIEVAGLALPPREETFKKTQAIAERLGQRADKSTSPESLTAWNERGFEPFPAYTTAWTFLLC